MKAILFSILILGGFLVGGLGILAGLKKNKTRKRDFNLSSFLSKGFKGEGAEGFTGSELIAFGVLCVVTATILLFSYKDIFF